MAHSDFSLNTEVVLPVAITDTAGLNRLLRGVKDYEDMVVQSKLAKKTSKRGLPVRPNELLAEVAEGFSISLLSSSGRSELQKILEDIKERAPVIHVSFSTEPTDSAVVRLVSWFRENVHPWSMISVRVEPGIVLGAVVRTPNKLFDFSARRSISERKLQLGQKIGGLL